MMTQAVAQCLVLLLVVALSNCLRPAYIGCQSSLECGKNGCCVVGLNRYSTPVCRPRGDVGDQCIPGGEEHNVTLSYPDGVSVELTGVHYVFCPCQGGLECGDDDQEGPRCANPNPHTNNRLEYNEEYDYVEY